MRLVETLTRRHFVAHPHVERRVGFDRIFKRLFLKQTSNGHTNIWCTLDDHPKGWEGTKMDAGAFSKLCEYVATATWGWTDETITHVRLTTDAYALSDRDKGGRHHREYRNRPDDVEWAAAKVAWLFSLAGIECPPIKVADDDDEESSPEIAEAKRKAEKDLTCPHCGSRLCATPVYFQSERRILLTCTNSGSCNFREM